MSKVVVFAQTMGDAWNWAKEHDLQRGQIHPVLEPEHLKGLSNFEYVQVPYWDMYWSPSQRDNLDYWISLGGGRPWQG